MVVVGHIPHGERRLIIFGGCSDGRLRIVILLYKQINLGRT